MTKKEPKSYPKLSDIKLSKPNNNQNYRGNQICTDFRILVFGLYSEHYTEHAETPKDN